MAGHLIVLVDISRNGKTIEVSRVCEPWISVKKKIE
jgi:hypothetical protein